MTQLMHISEGLRKTVFGNLYVNYLKFGLARPNHYLFVEVNFDF